MPDRSLKMESLALLSSVRSAGSQQICDGEEARGRQRHRRHVGDARKDEPEVGSGGDPGLIAGDDDRTNPHRSVPGRLPEDVHHIVLLQLGAYELTHELAVHLPARDLGDPEPPHLGALFAFE
jgi:hypothetical protein